MRRSTVGRRGATRGRPGSGVDRWLASWRFALRLGGREARRNPGRSLLIVSLVATPVLLITAFLTFFSSQDISAAEGLDRELGTSVAAVGPASGPVGWVQGSDGSHIEREATTTAGYSVTDPWDGDRVTATVGSPVTRVGRTDAQLEGATDNTRVGGGRLAFGVLVLDGPPSGPAAPLASLVSGRWAEAPDEVVVTRAGLAQGLPSSGLVSLMLGAAEEATPLKVVGVAEAAFNSDQNAELVLPAAGAPVETRWQWLINRTDPVQLAEAEQWALSGLDVVSRDLLLNPGPSQDWQVANDRAEALFFAMIGLAVLLETVLLAGPAFAVSAARQRHSLALAAAQGAARSDLRRAVIAYGLVLAVLATLVAVVAGVALGVGGALLLAEVRPWQHVHLELPWLWIVLLSVASVLASGVAAWWPARSATRLDIMSVLRGQVVSGRVGRGWPALGVVLVVAGLAALASSTQVAPHAASPWMLGGTVLLGLGAMVLVPAILALVSRWSGRAPLPWRLAARDSMRQRSRAVPAVLATIVAVAVMSATATVAVSSTANEERQYTPLAPLGTVTVRPGPDTELTSTITKAVASTIPGATAYALTSLPTGPVVEPLVGERDDRPVQTVVPPTCEADDITMSWSDETSCFVGGFGAHVVAPVAALERTGALTTPMREVLEAGGLIVWADSPDSPSDERGTGKGVAVTAPARMLGMEGAAELTGPAVLEPVPVYRASSAEMDALRISDRTTQGYLTSETARSLGWQGVPGTVFVAGDQAVTPEQVTALEQELAQHDVSVYLERGYVPDDAARIITVVALGVFSLIALAAVVISTALTISEGQRDSATLAAVGGTRRTRRLLAAVHAILVGVVGALVGTTLGLVVGGVLSWTSTQLNYYQSGYEAWLAEGGIVAVPWLPLGLAVLAIPVVAAAVAWLSVRRDPVMTRTVT